MLFAHLVKSSHDRPLEQVPHAFNAVCVDIPYNPFLFRVVDGLVTGIVACNSDVGTKFIRVNGLSLILYSSFDKVMDGLLPDIWDTLDTDSPDPLDSAGNPCLVTLVAMTYILFLSAYQRLIYFNHADKRRAFKRLVPHRLPNPVAEIPGGLVGNPESTLHLVSGDPLLGFAHKIDSNKPFTQRQVGIVHDGSTHNRKLVSAASALPCLLALPHMGPRRWLFVFSSPDSFYHLHPLVRNALKEGIIFIFTPSVRNSPHYS